ncbi:MAG TPA: hypothetical protein VIK91_28090 [Nannocystis sp.]
MSTNRTIAFLLRGKSGSVELTPATIGLFEFNEFNTQVERFLLGSRRRGEVGHINVQVKDGSYQLVTVLSAALMGHLEPDLQQLRAREDSLGEIDPKRAEVLLEWQAASKKNPERSYIIRPRGSRSIELSEKTDYRAAHPPWVRVEKYFLGTITDIGGATRANVHLRLDDSDEIITIASDQDYLRQQPTNLVYQRALLRVEAEQNVATGALRNFRLIEFAQYSPAYDEAALDRFAEEGRRAWADVPDAAAWVRDLRGRE